MAVSIFDGVGRIITLASGVPIASGTNFTDAESEMYSEWKRWAKLGTNAKFAPAFRTVGGDPLGAGVDAGAYFFLQNQVRSTAAGGWVIRPPEQDGVFEIVGNIFPEDSDITIFSGTSGGFATQIRLNTSSLTQQVNVNEILAILSDSALTTATYDSAVTIDTVAGSPGTAFPIGNVTNPVDNITDALSIATSLNLRKYKIISPITIEGDHTNWTFEGQGDHTPLVIGSGNDFSNSVFQNLRISGNATGSSIDVIGCTLTDLTDFRGLVTSCGLAGITTLADGESIFANCYSTVAGSGTPAVLSLGQGVNLSFRGYNGGLTIDGIVNPNSKLSIDLGSGNVLLNSTNVSGTIVIRGVGTVTDNTAPECIVIDDGLVNAIFVSTATFEGAITVDTVRGVAGIAFPIGNRVNPVNNVADALTIANDLNIRKYIISEDLTLAGDHSSWTFLGEGGLHQITLVSGSSVNKSEFKNLDIQGYADGTVEIVDSSVCDLTNLQGDLRSVGMRGDITLASGTTNISHCFSAVEEHTSGPTISGSDEHFHLNLRGYNGDIRLGGINVDSSSVAIDLNSGAVILDDTNVSGTVVVRGVGNLTDNTGPGTTVEDGGLLNPDFISASTFNGAVLIDTAFGAPGTAFPAGNTTNPVNNLADAKTIADAQNITTYNVRNYLAVSQDHPNWSFVGEGANTVVVVVSGSDVSNCVFDNVALVGNLDDAQVLIRNSAVVSLVKFKGSVANSGLQGNNYVSPGSTVLAGCISLVGGNDFPHIHAVGSGTEVHLRQYSGPIMINDLQSSDSLVDIDFVSGYTLLGAGNSEGTITLRGIGTFDDMTPAAVTVLSSGVINPQLAAERVWGAELANQPTIAGSFGEYMTSKVLSVSKFLGLK